MDPVNPVNTTGLVLSNRQALALFRIAWESLEIGGPCVEKFSLSPVDRARLVSEIVMQNKEPRKKKAGEGNGEGEVEGEQGGSRETI